MKCFKCHEELDVDNSEYDFDSENGLCTECYRYLLSHEKDEMENILKGLDVVSLLKENLAAIKSYELLIQKLKTDNVLIEKQLARVMKFFLFFKDDKETK